MIDRLNNKGKIMVKLLLFILSLAYLFIEYFFNISLVNAVGNDIIYALGWVDTNGRHIAAIGLSLVVFRLILLIKLKKKLYSFLIAGLIIPPIYYTFFHAQEKLVDYIVEKTPIEKQREYTYNHVFQRGMANGSLNYDKFDFPVKDYEHDVMAMSTIYWGFGYPDFIEMSQNKTKKEFQTDLLKMYQGDFSNIKSYWYYKDTHDYWYEVASGMFKYYAYQKHEYNYLKKKTAKEIEEAWLKKEEAEAKLIDRYSSLKIYVDKQKRQLMNKGRFRKSRINDIRNVFYGLAGCSTLHCLEANDKYLKKISSYSVNKYSFDENCKYTNESRNKYTIVSLYGTKVKDRKTHYADFTKKGTAIECYVDIRNDEKDIHNKFLLEMKEKTGIEDWSPANSQEFRNHSSISQALSNLIFDESGYRMPSNWHYEDKEMFRKTIESYNIGQVKKQAIEQMNKYLGGEIPLNLKLNTFYKHPLIVKKLREMEGVFKAEGLSWQGRSLYGDKSKFIEYYKNSVPKKMVKYWNNDLITNNDFVTNIFKLTIIPAVSILFSLLFGLINLSFILSDIVLFLGRVKNKIARGSITALILITCVSLPAFNGNSYTKSDFYKNDMLPKMKDQNYIGAIVYDWFIKTETSIYKITDYDWRFTHSKSTADPYKKWGYDYLIAPYQKISLKEMQSKLGGYEFLRADYVVRNKGEYRVFKHTQEINPIIEPEQ
jgi:hypothetical protein